MEPQVWYEAAGYDPARSSLETHTPWAFEELADAEIDLIFAHVWSVFADRCNRGFRWNWLYGARSSYTAPGGAKHVAPASRGHRAR